MNEIFFYMHGAQS